MPFAHAALHGDLAEIEIDQLAHDVEAEAEALGGVAQAAGLLEALEDHLELFGGNAGAAIGDADHDLATIAGRRRAHRRHAALVAAIFERIDAEIDQHAADLLGIAKERRQARLDLAAELDTAGRGPAVSMVSTRPTISWIAHSRRDSADEPGFEAAEIEHVVDEAVEIVDPGADHAEIVALIVVQIADQPLIHDGGEFADNGQRRAEFMRDIVDEVMGVSYIFASR